jgi:hypothetical protein
MKHRVSELQGALLDAAVALAEGKTLAKVEGHGSCMVLVPWPQGVDQYDPSTDWRIGGALIERERIQMFTAGEEWMAKVNCMAGNLGVGPTPLIAACRAYVASRLGEEVELP